MIIFDVQGLEEIQARMSAVTADMQLKGGRFALRKAANILRDRIKLNAQRIDDPGTAESIAENVALRWSGRTFARTGNLAFRVGILGGARAKDGTTFYWRFLEFGTSKIRARPFMRPAMHELGQAIPAEFAQHYRRALDRAIKRAGR